MKVKHGVQLFESNSLDEYPEEKYKIIREMTLEEFLHLPGAISYPPETANVHASRKELIIFSAQESK